MNHWHRARVCVALAACLAAGVARGNERVVLMVGGIDKQIYLPARLAQRLDYFAAEGVDVELRSEESGVGARDQLLLGTVDGVIGFYDHTIDLQAKGKLVESVVQFARAPGEALLVSGRSAERVRTLADLRGRPVGVTGLGSSTDYLTRYLVLSAGAHPGELATTGMGSGTGFIAALAAGRIDAGMTSEPTVTSAVRGGHARLLVDLRTPATSEAVLGGPYPGACLYMSTSWVESHRPLVRRVAAALVRALRFIASHSAEDIARAAPPPREVDLETWVAALRESKPGFTADGAMPPQGPETVMRVLAVADRAVRGKPVDLARTWTGEFVADIP